MKNCDYCHREFECKNIKSLISLCEDMNGPNLPDNLRQEIDDLKSDLTATGYKYPFGNQTCDLIRENNLPGDFVNRGISLLNRVYAYKLSSREGWFSL